MEVCKNRSSGKYFILIEDLEFQYKYLLVTPTCKIKLLNRNLFEEPIQIEEETLLSINLVTDLQIDRYSEYKKDREEKQVSHRRIPIATIKGKRSKGNETGIKFTFIVNNSFLRYPSHPITIPKNKESLLVEKIYNGIGRRSQRTTIISLNGRKLNGHIYYGVTGGYPYYQIRVIDNYPSDYFGHLEIGEKISINIERISNEIQVAIIAFN